MGHSFNDTVLWCFRKFTFISYLKKIYLHLHTRHVNVITGGRKWFQLFHYYYSQVVKMIVVVIMKYNVKALGRTVTD